MPAFFVSAPGALSSLKLSPGTLPGLFFAATQRPTGLPTGPQNPSSVSLRGAMAMGRWHRSRAQLSSHPRPPVMPPARKHIPSLEALGSADSIQRMLFHARTDALCERLDAGQAQICGGGASGGTGPARRPARTAQEAGQGSWPKAARPARGAGRRASGQKSPRDSNPRGPKFGEVSHRSERCDGSFRRPAPARIDLDQPSLIPSCHATLPGGSHAPTGPNAATGCIVSVAAARSPHIISAARAQRSRQV